MPDLPDGQDYYEQNKLALNGLVDAFESALRVSTHRVLLYRHHTTDFYFMEGKAQPDMCQEPSGELDAYLRPEERAAEQNRMFYDQANRTLSALLRNTESGDTEPYQHATWRELFTGSAGDPTGRTTIVGVELFGGLGPRAYYTLTSSEDGVNETLVLFVSNGAVELAYHELMPRADELFEQCRAMFGFSSRAVELLVGACHDTDELESNIDSIRTATLALGIYTSKQVIDVLDAVKERALLILTKRGLARTSMSLGEPSIQVICDFTDDLNSIDLD